MFAPQMTNATARKFGYPDTLIREYGHWLALLRPAQATLGTLVLVAKDEARRFPEIGEGAFKELAQVTRETEAALAQFRPFEKINYLMLMMVDPDVHFHVLPRYPGPQEFEGLKFPDPGWPGAPNLGAAVEMDEGMRKRLVQAIGAHFPRAR